MLKKIIGVGNKIELTRVGQLAAQEKDNGNEKKVYVSQVYDIVDDDRLKIAIPIDGGKVVLMPNNARIDACFYTSKGLYQGRFIIVDRFKEGNLMMQVIELVNDLQKYQRRQYFRLSCTMSIGYKKLEEEEITELTQVKNMAFALENTLMSQAVALDISGGGMRYVAKERLNRGDIIALRIAFNYEGKVKTYGLLARVIASNTSKNNSKLFEHRVEFLHVANEIREEIIKFIFDEERKRRKKESGQ